MGIWAKLFGTSEVRRFKRQWRKGLKRTEVQYAPLECLLVAVVTAADQLWRSLWPIMGFEPGSTPSDAQIFVFYELVFFSSYVSLRSAMETGYTVAQAVKICAYGDPLLATTAIDRFCGHWPLELKEKVAREFLRNISNARRGFNECSLAFPDVNDFKRELALLIAEVCERPGDETVAAAVVKAVADARKSFEEIQSALNDVAPIIDSVESVEFLESLPLPWGTGLPRQYNGN